MLNVYSMLPQYSVACPRRAPFILIIERNSRAEYDKDCVGSQRKKRSTSNMLHINYYCGARILNRSCKQRVASGCLTIPFAKCSFDPAIG